LIYEWIEFAHDAGHGAIHDGEQKLFIMPPSMGNLACCDERNKVGYVWPLCRPLCILQMKAAWIFHAT